MSSLHTMLALRSLGCLLAVRYVFTIDITGQHLWRVPVVEGAYHDFGSSGRLLVADKVARPHLHACSSSCLPAHVTDNMPGAAMLPYTGEV